MGQEAAAVGVVTNLASDDAIVSTHRDHAHALARGIEPGRIMAEMMGRQEGCSRGRGGSMHLFDAATRFYGGSAIVGSGLPVGVGLALADRMQGRRRVTAVFFGEGAIAEGEFHESMNLASLWHLPVLFCCENNRYAMGTAIDLEVAQADLALRAAGYGIPARNVDGMDVRAVRAAARKARREILTGGGPVLLELFTYRYRAHSMFDPERYRSKKEVARWRRRDPIERLKRELMEVGVLSAPGWERIVQQAEETVGNAIEFGSNGTLEPTEDLTRFVTSGRAQT